ncbi:MAG TPA: hypothetical protein PLO44_01830 [Candidatus Paceibacterota bacterium]|nr:hypothetical protein [Candidatus Paceibacterota bacterium]
MAQYSHLPIYNTAFSLLREMYERIPKFGKQYKYLLGGEIIKSNIEIIRLILEINNNRELKIRKELLDNLIWLSESIIINLRIANELKQLGGEKSYLYLVEKSVALSKQAEGWRKSVI